MNTAVMRFLFVSVFSVRQSLWVAAYSEVFMNSKLIVAILLAAIVPVCAQAQKPNPAKVTNADAQNVVKTISGDKTRTQTFCDISKLGDQADEAAQKKDMKKVEELNQKMQELVTKLGPEYAAFMNALQDMDPNSPEGQKIDSTLQGLDKLCPK
jgi:hypothetical protein